MMVENLIGRSQYLWEVSDTGRSLSVDDLIEDLYNSIINDDIQIWHEKLATLDVPYHYTKLFATEIANLVCLLFPKSVSYTLMDQIVQVLRPKLRSFVLDEYVPKLYEAIGDYQLPVFYKLILLIKAAGVLTKLIYAFLFQE